jgi:hypothetical protein
VGRLPHLEHHVVGEVDDVADRTDSDGFEADAHPLRGRAHPDIEHAPTEARAQIRGLDFDRPGVRGRSALLRERHGQRLQRDSIEDRDLARHAVHVHAIDAIGRDVQVEHGIAVAHLDPVHGEAGGGEIVADLADVARRLHELAQPGDEDLHRRRPSIT